MTRKQSRLYGILILLLGVGLATALTLTALKDNVTYFRTPTEIITGKYPELSSGRGLRLGGMVEKGSVQHEGDVIVFRVTDMHNSLTVKFRGVPPDLFREGQGVIADGKMTPEGVFIAERILAKHDEKYMPPNMANMGNTQSPAKP